MKPEGYKSKLIFWIFLFSFFSIIDRQLILISKILCKPSFFLWVLVRLKEFCPLSSSWWLIIRARMFVNSLIFTFRVYVQTLIIISIRSNLPIFSGCVFFLTDKADGRDKASLTFLSIFFSKGATEDWLNFSIALINIMTSMRILTLTSNNCASSRMITSIFIFNIIRDIL